MPYRKGMKKASRKPNSKRFVKSVQAIVRRELSEELEEKQAIVQYDNVPIQRNIPSGLVLNGQGNFFRLLPPITQSTVGEAGRAYGERIGNEISLKKLSIKYFCNYNSPDALEIRPQDHKIAVRVMILKCKLYNDVNKAFDDMPTDQILRFGNTVGVTGPGPFEGDPLDLQSQINRDIFSVRYDKMHVLTAPVNISGATGVDLIAEPSGLKFGEKTLTFGKNGLKLKFASNTDAVPNNFGYFMVVGTTSLSAPSRPASLLCNMTVNCNAIYTDA